MAGIVFGLVFDLSFVSSAMYHGAFPPFEKFARYK